MKTYRLLRQDGFPYAFEVANVYVGPRRVVEILTGIQGVSDIRLGKAFDKSSDTRVRFKFRGHEFVVWEPYGDNSRYWIGPEQDNENLDISLLEQAFENYRPPLLVKIIGDLITLNFKSLLKDW